MGRPRSRRCGGPRGGLSVTREQLRKRATYYADPRRERSVELPGKEAGPRGADGDEDRPVPVADNARRADGRDTASNSNGHRRPCHADHRRLRERQHRLHRHRSDAYKVGGYEPNTSKLLPEAEQIILDELGRLADRVVGDVFESFSKHPKEVEKREAEEKARLKQSSSK